MWRISILFLETRYAPKIVLVPHSSPVIFLIKLFGIEGNSVFLFFFIFVSLFIQLLNKEDKKVKPYFPANWNTVQDGD